jgi:mono/diheme cytochrome c family protein
MRKSIYLLLVLAVIGALALAACDGGGGQTPAAGGTARPTPPPEYAGKTNPKTNDAASAAAGKDLYAINCTSCHGETAMGDGPTAASLDPKPKPLASEMKSLSDDYMFWRISEGGAFPPFNSAMPAWKASLTEDQIWQVITYLRTLAK